MSWCEQTWSSSYNLYLIIKHDCLKIIPKCKSSTFTWFFVRFIYINHSESPQMVAYWDTIDFYWDTMVYHGIIYRLLYIYILLLFLSLLSHLSSPLTCQLIWDRIEFRLVRVAPRNAWTDDICERGAWATTSLWDHKRTPRRWRYPARMA